MTNIVHFSRRVGSERDLLAGRPPAEIELFPAVHSHRKWLFREGLKIAASVGTSSFTNIERAIRLRRIEAGVTGPAVDAEVKSAIEYVRTVVEFARAAGGLLRTTPPGQTGGAA